MAGTWDVGGVRQRACSPIVLAIASAVDLQAPTPAPEVTRVGVAATLHAGRLPAHQR